jgi:iron complex outermembrane receptor protein
MARSALRAPSHAAAGVTTAIATPSALARARRAASGSVALAVLLLPACPSLAQRADDNAVRAADDAFGTSVGNENIGLYSPYEVRGFSAVDAGNVRLDGLYFDQQVNPSNHLAPSSAMRVGISAQGYPLPAPTGIVDYELARAGKERVVSTVLSYGPYGGSSAEVGLQLPLDGERLGVAAGATYSSDVSEFDIRERFWAVAATLRWRPVEGVEVLPFYSRTVNADTEAQPLTFMGGAYLPPKFERGEFYGQPWADGEGIGQNYGAIANFALGSAWTLKAGVFRSEFEQPHGYADLFLDTAPDGAADRFMVADVDSRFASTSGEARLTTTFDEDDRRHTFHFAARGRNQTRRYGGEDVVPLGRARVGEYAPVPTPAFTFGPKTRDEVRQFTGAVAYQGRWGALWEYGAGLQKTDYLKEVVEPDGTRQEGEDDPWLYNASAAFRATERIAFYASYATGLEEGGVAPDNAVNRDAAAPAIRTKQWDAGMRWTLHEGLALIAGVFDVRKPYYSLDRNSVFRELGEQRHRGLEMSITGQVVPGLNVVAGTVRMEPRVSGEEVDAGLIGEVPVGQVERLTIASADWQLPWVPKLSLDVTMVSVGERMASTDNRLATPARTTFDLGARYRFRIGRAAATLRGRVGNVTDHYGWRTNASGVITHNAQRSYSVNLAADF